MTVLIAGGGIGGLTLALSLHQIGVPCRVFESVAALKPLGVGINVLPHAVRELIELGLLDKLDASGVRTKELAFFSKHGKPIWSEPRGLEAGYKWPQFSIHRGTLQQILLDAVIERLGAGQHPHQPSSDATGRRPPTASAPISSTRPPASPAGSYDGSLLIAADGIHSAVREKLYPQEGPPLWNGRILWRGITTSDAFLSGRTMIMAGHEVLKFVCYPISKHADANGKFEINWVAERLLDPSYKWRREDYNRTGNLGGIPAAVRTMDIRLARRRRPDPQLPAGLRISAGRSRSGVAMDVSAASTLMGDAAHPMYPIGSNGASQAILDARVITREILAHGETAPALAGL